jgi:hypothetical protein
MERNYIKLKELVGGTFRVESVNGIVWKKWDEHERRMVTSAEPSKGYRKTWQVQTDKGQLDLGQGQIGVLLEAVFDGEKSELIGATFQVQSNGKTGKEIRYYFNQVRGDTSESGDFSSVDY